MSKLKNLSRQASAAPSLPAKQIQGRKDLSFTSQADGGRIIGWDVPRERDAYWHDGVETGRQHFAEVVSLAGVNEYQACVAIEHAFNDPGWRPWCGIEAGFSKAVAEAVIVGLRAIRAGAEIYDLRSALQAEEPGPSGYIDRHGNLWTVDQYNQLEDVDPRKEWLKPLYTRPDDL